MATKAVKTLTAEPNAILKRINLVAPKEGEETPAAIAEKAARLLGYTGGMTSHGVAGDLGKVLMDLDIRPYDIKRVAAYKEKKRKQGHAERLATKRNSWVQIRSGWAQVALAKYTGSIPDFVLAKAVQIKEAMPEAVFFVDVLKINTKRLPDPFLVVKYKTEKYWVEVWDEAEFEAQLIDD